MEMLSKTIFSNSMKQKSMTGNSSNSHEAKQQACLLLRNHLFQ